MQKQSRPGHNQDSKWWALFHGCVNDSTKYESGRWNIVACSAYIIEWKSGQMNRLPDSTDNNTLQPKDAAGKIGFVYSFNTKIHFNEEKN